MSIHITKEMIDTAVELIDTISEVDEKYWDFCTDLDSVHGEEEGSNYHSPDGTSVEFYIEATDWHKISRLVRHIKNLEKMGGKINEKRVDNRNVLP